MNLLLPPPRLLLGCTLLFWGAMCGRPLVGLIAALVVEARHWVRLRWDFDDDACARSWQLATILAAMGGVLLLIDGSRDKALPELLSWIPILMTPVQFVQSYGLRPGIPLGSISYFARRQRLRAERLGLPIPSGMFHFGNVTFFLCLIAATVGDSADSELFLPGVLILCGWRILSTRQSRAVILVPVLLLAGLGGTAGNYGIQKLEERYSFGGSSNETMFNPGFAGTMIGSSGRVSLSPEVKWRLRPIKGDAPSLLRTATFTEFAGTAWRAPVNKANPFIDLENQVLDTETIYRVIQPDRTLGLSRYAPPTEIVKLPSFLLRGGVKRGDPLPVPGTVNGVSGIELEAMQLNHFGTTRLIPKEPVLNATVYWNGTTQPDPNPDDLEIMENMIIPKREEEAIKAISAQLQLTPDVPETLAKLKSWFSREFSYSLQLEIDRSDYDNYTGPISRFLTEGRTGHCEYFATAAALLLRNVGIPARYTVGYAVVEQHPNRREFLIRGTHGHAWVRVWDGKQWVDFDPTPADWSALAVPQPSLTQRLSDFLKHVREDFYVWRKVPGNQTLITILMSTIGIGMGSFIVVRLWRSRSIDPSSASGLAKAPEIPPTALHDLEPLIRKSIGLRPPGEPFASWVLRGLPTGIDKSQIQEALGLHQTIRFDPRGDSEDARSQLKALVIALKCSLKTQPSPQAR